MSLTRENKHSLKSGIIHQTFIQQVNWEFQSAGDEDEGWQSDAGPMKPSRELQELVSRVALLETQMKNSKLEGKSGPEEDKRATWPGWVYLSSPDFSHTSQ